MISNDNDKNVFYGLFYQFLFIVIGFLSRKLLVKQVGLYLIGINGVFDNIVAMLDLADFGISSACMYYLYDAFSKKDYDKAATYFQSFRKLYRIIAGIVGFIGFIIILNIELIVEVGYGTDVLQIRIIFLLHLLRAILFYLLTSYRWTLQCDGKRYYSLKADIICLLFFSAFKILFLILYKSYIIYLFLSVLEILLSNLYVILCFRKNYNGFDFNVKKNTSVSTKNVINYGKSLAINNFNSFINNCTDNIVISKICGLITVGFLSNYYLLSDAVKSVTQQFFSSIEAAVFKKLYLSNDQSSKIEIYDNMMCLSYFIASFSDIFLFGLITVFIGLYFGNDYCLNNYIPLFMCVNLSIILLQYPSTYILKVQGLMDKTLVFSTIMMVTNLTTSIALTFIIGPEGALIGTIIANIIYSFGIDSLVYKHTQILSKKIIAKKIKFYFLLFLQFLLVFFLLPSKNTIGSFIHMFVICALIVLIFSFPMRKKLINFAKQLK